MTHTFLLNTFLPAFVEHTTELQQLWWSVLSTSVQPTLLLASPQPTTPVGQGREQEEQKLRKLVGQGEREFSK